MSVLLGEKQLSAFINRSLVGIVGVDVSRNEKWLQYPQPSSRKNCNGFLPPGERL